MRKKLLFYVLSMMLLAFSATVATAQEYYYAAANETTESTWKETCGLYVERLITAGWGSHFHKGHSFRHLSLLSGKHRRIPL